MHGQSRSHTTFEHRTASQPLDGEAELFRTRNEIFRTSAATFPSRPSVKHKNNNCLSAPYSREDAVSRRLKQAAILFVILFAAAQLVRPGRTNPATDRSRTIRAHPGTTSELVAVLDRSCRDCHSNATVWPWYTQIAPLSWLMARGVAEGRKAVNFSEWGGYPPEVQRTLLSVSCDDATSGKMPGPYTLVRPETKLSSQDIETICAAARQAEADASN
jgi:hypothetical protein